MSLLENKRKKTALKNSPIGIFDSGFGGLTVLRAVSQKLPNENIIYFGDTAHLPYGDKSPQTVEKYSLSIVNFLKSKDVKLIVIACNTASVFAYKKLKAESPLPIIGVVDAGVKSALKKAKKSIMIIGTYGTIKSRDYEKKIRRKKPFIKIYSRSCPLFVPLIEEGWLKHPVTKEVAKIYLEEYRGKIDSVILACTHYPLITALIAETLGNDVTIINSANAVAEAVEKKIKEFSIAAERNRSDVVHEFFVSDAPEVFKERAPLFLGKNIDKVSLKRL